MRCLVVFLVSLAVCACGGGGAGPGSPGTLAGMAALGAGISGRIQLTDGSGNRKAVDTTDGHFSLSLAGLKPPLLLKVQWTDGSGMHWLYSFASQGGTANITPLTHVAVSLAAASTTLDALFEGPNAAAFGAVQAALPAAMARLQSDLRPLMRQYAVAGDNPITVGFNADHTGMDALLDSIDLQSTSVTLNVSDRRSGALLLSVPTQHMALGITPTGWGLADAVQAAEVDVAVNAAGVALAVWSEAGNGQYGLKARLLDGSSPVQALDIAVTLGRPRVAFDGQGHAMAVWSRSNGQRSSVWASHYGAQGAGWSTPTQLSPDLGVHAGSPNLALDPAGNAIAVWQQDNGSPAHTDGWVARYSATTGNWSPASRLTDGSNRAYGLHVALNASGQGVLAWQQERGAGGSLALQPGDVWARRVDSRNDSAWGAAQLLNAVDGVARTAYLYGPLSVAVNASGAAAVLWSQRESPTQAMDVVAAMLVPAAGWGNAQALTAGSTDDCFGPRVALDAAGNAIAVWQQQTDYSLYGGTSRYVAGVGWGAAGHFVDSTLGDAMRPNLAMDAAGNATVVWLRWSPGAQEDVMVNRFLVGSGWDFARVYAPIGSGVAISRGMPAVAVNANQQTRVVWGLQASAVASGL